MQGFVVDIATRALVEAVGDMLKNVMVGIAESRRPREEITHKLGHGHGKRERSVISLACQFIEQSRCLP